MPQYYNYRGPYFPLEAYADKFTKKETVQKMEAFLQAKQGQVFDFRKEFADYLHADCRLLAMGLARLTQEWLVLQLDLDRDRNLTPLHPLTPPYFTFSR